MQLLDYLGEPVDAVLMPWPLVSSPPVSMTRHDALSSMHVMVVSRQFEQPTIIRSGDVAMAEPTRAGVFNRINWERLKPKPSEGLVDSNASPVLLWTLATHDSRGLGSGSIGSQADAMSAVSDEYARWANRVMNWIRRKGVKVWGLETRNVRPDLDVRRTDVTTVVAMPGALSALESGVTGH